MPPAATAVQARPDPQTHDAAIGELSRLLGSRLSVSAAIRAQHASTLTWIAAEPPDAVAFPRTTAEVAAIVAICTRHGMPVVPFEIGRAHV